jgi:hypothetical protein
MAEGMRFELTVRISPYTRFPGERLQPLGHPSTLEELSDIRNTLPMAI